MRTVPCRVRYTIVSWDFSPCRYLSVRRRGVIYHVPLLARSVYCRVVVFLRLLFLFGSSSIIVLWMRNVMNHAPTPFRLSIPPWMRNVMNHAHIVLILLQSYHTNNDRMYHICKKLYHICNFQRNLLENVRYMYTLRQIGINIYQKTDLRQPYGRESSRSAHRVQYIAWCWAWLRLLFLFGSSFIMVL